MYTMTAWNAGCLEIYLDLNLDWYYVLIGSEKSQFYRLLQIVFHYTRLTEGQTNADMAKLTNTVPNRETHFKTPNVY
jgi:hypothetical protein